MPRVSSTGAFIRSPSCSRHNISAPGAKYPPEAGRYLVYVSYACPWASRVLMTRTLKGLQNYLHVAVVAPKWAQTAPEIDQHRGWVFDESVEGGTSDPLFGATTLREVYNKCAEAAAAAGGIGSDHAPPTKFTVPLLVDTKTKTIVNNESSEIIRMIDAEFPLSLLTQTTDDISSSSSSTTTTTTTTSPPLLPSSSSLVSPLIHAIASENNTLYPQALRASIDKVNEEIYDAVNNGVYRAGFATSQEAYDEAVVSLFACLDKYDNILSTRRFLCGTAVVPADASGSGVLVKSVFTEADIRFFVTLVRFDQVYHTHFKCNKQLLRQYTHLHAYVRDIYQLPGIAAETVNMTHTRNHYYGSHPTIDKYGIVPIGPDDSVLLEPHKRDSLP